MEVKNNKFSFFIFFLLILLVFKTWFIFSPLSSGDWSYNFEKSIKAFNLFPYSWNFNLNSGLGGASSFILSLSSYFLFTTSFLFNIFKLPWVLIERLVWFWPFLIISVSSSYYLFKKLFSNKFALLSSFIYLFNTYILMLVGGGQMGIAMAYSLSPLILLVFVKLTDRFNNANKNFKFSILNSQLPLLAGLLLSILVMFDLRITYVILLAVFIYWILKQVELSKVNHILDSFILVFILPGIITFLLHSFWIIPLMLTGKNPLIELGSIYSSSEAVRFFSFAKFEDAISLLHPNWPENIFGKVGFLKPEFLLLPILAFASLLFVPKIKDQKTKIYILYFALLGLVGAFLAKGANEPFGNIYLWMFDHVPGFIMFRDPTKWYTLVAISYSTLIPFTIWKIYELLKSKPKFQIKSKNQILNLQNLFLFVIVFCLLYLIRPALFGELTGTFKTTSVPNDYIKLEQFLSSQNSFSRTLWVPAQQRFGFYANTHPAIPAQNFLKTVNYSQIFKKMRAPESEKVLREAGVKYVIVPYDSQGEIFLKDRKYDEKLHENTINEVRKIKWLKEIDGFGRIKVFRISDPKDHFWSSSTILGISYKFINPTKYEVAMKNAKKGDILVFSEGFDKYWVAKSQILPPAGGLKSQKYSGLFNSFVLTRDGSYDLTIYYAPQDWVNFGLAISVVSLIAILVLLGLKERKW